MAKFLKAALLGFFFILGLNTLLNSAYAFHNSFYRRSEISRTQNLIAPDTKFAKEIAERAAPAVVLINAYEDVSNPFDLLLFGKAVSIKERISSGSGFFINSGGYLLTNKHVVSDNGMEYTVNIDGNSEIPARVIYRDPDYDLAVLKVENGNYPSLELARNEKIKIGDQVVGIGNALGRIIDSISAGNVSGINRNIFVRDGSEIEKLKGLIEVNSRLYPGDSGGPLLNSKGEVIGVNVATAVRTRISYSIPIDAVYAVMKRAGI